MMDFLRLLARIANPAKQPRSRRSQQEDQVRARRRSSRCVRGFLLSGRPIAGVPLAILISVLLVTPGAHAEAVRGRRATSPDASSQRARATLPERSEPSNATNGTSSTQAQRRSRPARRKSPSPLRVGIGVMSLGAVTLLTGGILFTRKEHVYEYHSYNGICTKYDSNRNCLEVDRYDRKFPAASKGLMIAGATIILAGALIPFLLRSHRNRGRATGPKVTPFGSWAPGGNRVAGGVDFSLSF